MTDGLDKFYAQPNKASRIVDKKELLNIMDKTDGTIIAWGSVWKFKPAHIGSDLFELRLEKVLKEVEE